MRRALILFPTIRNTHESWAGAGIDKKESTDDLIFDASISNKNVTSLRNNIELRKSRIIKTITQIEIPVIDDVSTYDWAAITSDEYQSFLKFKDLISIKLLDIISKENTFEYETEIEKAGLSIKRGFELLSKDLYKHKINSVVQNIGGAIGLITATLIAVDMNLFKHADKIIGTSGVLANLLNYYNQRHSLKLKQEGNDLFYLFLLEKKIK